jgi:uncharacterized coiled-coil DUF342 family protein
VKVRKMAGISEYDYLNSQAQLMLEKLNSMKKDFESLSSEVVNIADSIDVSPIETLMTDLENAKAFIDQNNLQVAKDTINTSKTAIDKIKKDRTAKKDKIGKLKEITDPLKTKITEATGIVSDLIPVINTAIKEKTGDGNMWYHYECRSCSKRCPFWTQFVPPHSKFYPKCFLDGSEVNWVPVDSEGTVIP